MIRKPKHTPTSKSSAERFQPRRVRRWPTPAANFPCSRPEATCRTPSICTCWGTWPLCRATSAALIPPLSSERSPSLGMSAVARACAHWGASLNTSRPWWAGSPGTPWPGRRSPPSVPPTESELVRLTMAGLSRAGTGGRPFRLRPLLDDAVEAILATARLPRERDRRGNQPDAVPVSEAPGSLPFPRGRGRIKRLCCFARVPLHCENVGHKLKPRWGPHF